MSSFNWWDDDDDDEKIAVGRESSLSQFSQHVSQLFRCENCGGTDSYHDSTSGQDVCTLCFTQSQVNLSQEIDDEDINVLAARRGTALKAIRQSLGRANTKGKLPLESLDQSKTLPTLDLCLEAMSLVIMNAARLFAMQVLGLDTVADRTEYLQTVKNLWIRFLCAWMEGANELGERFPEWRFSFRDHFLPTSTRGLVMANLAYWSKKTVEEQKASANIKTEDMQEEDCADDDSRNLLNLDSPGEERGVPEEAKTECKETKQISPSTAKRPIQTTNRSTKKPKRVNTSIERLILSIRDRSDCKQAALKIEPSMDLVLAVLWLACSKSGVTSFQACHWMAQSPLLAAFELLPASLQPKVSLIQHFFSAPCAPRPRTLEETASLLAAACQMKTEGNWSYPNNEVLFHSRQAVPLLIARLVANAGLNQVVLNRTLGLLGIDDDDDDNGTAPLQGITLDHFSRNEDFLAVIAIACIMDPEWTSWSFCLSGKGNIPFNECHFAHLKNADVENYLNFLDSQKLFTKSRVWDGFDELARLALQDHSDSESEEEPVRTCPIVSDLSSTYDDKEAKFHLLLGFLAYSVQGEVSRIRDKLSLLLESTRGQEVNSPTNLTEQPEETKDKEACKS